MNPASHASAEARNYKMQLHKSSRIKKTFIRRQIIKKEVVLSVSV